MPQVGIIVDLKCIRRVPHNELDDASITLPKMAAAMDPHPTILQSFRERLAAQYGIDPRHPELSFDQENAEKYDALLVFSSVMCCWFGYRYLEQKFVLSALSPGDCYRLCPDKQTHTSEQYITGHVPVYDHNVPKRWQRFNQQIESSVCSAPTEAVLRHLSEFLFTPPHEHFTLHEHVEGLLARNREFLEADEPRVCWATAEALALGTMLLEGKHVRI